MGIGDGKRMNKNLVIGSTMMVVFLGAGMLTGYFIPKNNQEQQEEYDTLLSDFQELNDEYSNLLGDYNNLEANFTELQKKYNILIEDNATLTEEYNELLSAYTLLNETYFLLLEEFDILTDELSTLQVDYDDLLEVYNQLDTLYSLLELNYSLLETKYNILSQQWDTLATWIRGMTLPAQYMVFAEAVRRYYFEDHYVQDRWSTGNVSGYYYEVSRFMRDVVLHDSQIAGMLEGSWFPEVSNALTDCLIYGNSTEQLAFNCFYWAFWPWLPNWNGYGLSGNELNDIDTIVDWCINEIDYEYDTDITWGQESYYWDYIKFPVETAFRTMGDCEDQALLCAAYLESCGFETMLAGFHDAEYPGGLYHRVLLVEITDKDAFFWKHPFGILWGFSFASENWWCFIDTTWDVPFGSRPGWMQHYVNYGFYTEDVTFAVCDIDGVITL